MTASSKNMRIEFKLFELYGLRAVMAAAEREQVRAADFVALAETVLSERQALAFAARWPTLTTAEQAEICKMVEHDHG
jgi:hypothetical protein